MKKAFLTPVIKVINLPKTDIVTTSAYATGSDGYSGDGEGGNGEIPED